MPARGAALPGIVQALRWDGDGDALAAVHAGFLDLASGALGALVRGRDGDVNELVAAVSAGGLLRVVLAPETTGRLLSGAASDEAVAFVRRALAVELARDGHRVDAPAPLWSALGDAAVMAQGEFASAPSIAGAPALDLDSPYVRRLELTGAGRTVMLRPMAAADRDRVVAALAEAADAIAATGHDIRDLVLLFLRVIALRQRDGSGFEVTSNGRHIGRATAFGSAWAEVDPAALAEAMVHESIHSLLLMQEHQDPWLRPRTLYSLESRVPSPWTGSPLRVDSFFHACFVWYGLLEFWRRAEAAGSFAAGVAEPRAARAASGFLRGPPLDRLGPDVGPVAPELRDAVEEMHARACELSAREGAAWS